MLRALLAVASAAVLAIPATALARNPSCICTVTSTVRPCHEKEFFGYCKGATPQAQRQKKQEVQSEAECRSVCLGLAQEVRASHETTACPQRAGQQVALAISGSLPAMGVSEIFKGPTAEKGRYLTQFSVCPRPTSPEKASAQKPVPPPQQGLRPTAAEPQVALACQRLCKRSQGLDQAVSGCRAGKTDCAQLKRDAQLARDYISRSAKGSNERACNDGNKAIGASWQVAVKSGLSRGAELSSECFR